MAIELSSQSTAPPSYSASIQTAHWEVEVLLRDETLVVGDHWMGNNHHKLLVEGARVSMASTGDGTPVMQVWLDDATELFAEQINPAAQTQTYTGTSIAVTSYIAAGTKFDCVISDNGAIYTPYYGLRISLFGRWDTSA